MDLSLTFAEPAAYEVVALVSQPAAPGWLDLPALHARLLPLALAAGHARLVLRADVGYPTGPSYEALASGGAADVTVYVVAGSASAAPERFAVALETALRQAVGFSCAQL